MFTNKNKPLILYVDLAKVNRTVSEKLVASIQEKTGRLVIPLPKDTELKEL